MLWKKCYARIRGTKCEVKCGILGGGDIEPGAINLSPQPKINPERTAK